MKAITIKDFIFPQVISGEVVQFCEVVKPQPDDRGLRTTNVPFEDWHGNEIKPRYKVGEKVYLKEPYYIAYNNGCEILER